MKASTSKRLQLIEQRDDSAENCPKDNREELLLFAEIQVQVARMLIVEFPASHDSAVPHLAKAWRLLQRADALPPLQSLQAETLGKLLKEDRAFYQDDTPPERLGRSKVWEFSNLVLDHAVRSRRREKLLRLKDALSSGSMRRIAFVTFIGVAALLAAIYVFVLAPIFFPVMRYSAEFFDGKSLQGRSVAATTFSELHFPSFGGALPKGFDGNNFSARFDTCLFLKQKTPVRFVTTSDDGSRVLVNGDLVVDNWREQGMTEQDGVRQLDAGIHHVRLEYFQARYGAGLVFRLNHAETGASLTDNLQIWDRAKGACL